MQRIDLGSEQALRKVRTRFKQKKLKSAPAAFVKTDSSVHSTT